MHQASLAERVPGIVRPRFRRDVALAWREPGVLQVHDEPHAVIMRGVDEAAVRWLDLVDGTRSWAELDALAAGPDAPAAGVHRLLDGLGRAGALDDAAAMPEPWRALAAPERMALLGDLAAAGLGAGDPRAAVRVLERRHVTAVEVVGEGLLADEVRAAVAVSGLSAGTERSGSTIRVVARPGHPDVLDDLDVLDYDTPHLIVAAHGRAGLVGPLVVPGRTSCARCRHLHRLDQDPRWGWVSLQLAAGTRRLPVPPLDRLLLRLVAARAVLLVRAWADDPQDIAAWGNLAYEIGLAGGELTRVARPLHPCCGCAWPGQADTP